MGRLNIRMPDDFLVKLSRLNENADKIAVKVLEAGAKPLKEKAVSNLKAVVGKNTKYKSRSKGDLAESIGITTAKQDKDGNWNIKVGIGDSKDSKGVSNALKASVLEYGKSGQPPKPWLKTATSSSKKECIEVMKSELDKEIRGI